MTIKANRILLERQASIEVECIHWKTMQTDYSYDLDFYRFCDWKINSLNASVSAGIIMYEVVKQRQY